MSLPFRFPVLASHTNGPNNTSPSNKPAANVTPWRRWNLQHVANYDFRDSSQRESSSNGPELIPKTDDGVTYDRRPQVETPKRVLIGTWNVKKKATQVEATIFDATDKTQWPESRTIPSKFILEMVRYNQTMVGVGCWLHKMSMIGQNTFHSLLKCIFNHS